MHIIHINVHSVENELIKFITDSGIKELHIYTKLDMNIRTWKRRLADPTTFSVAELTVLSEALRLPMNDLLKKILVPVK